MNSQSTVSAAGLPLANAVDAPQSPLYSRYLRGSAAPTQGMGDLGLPAAVPVVVFPVLARSRVGCRYLEGGLSG